MSDIKPINVLKVQYSKTHTLVGEYGYPSVHGWLLERKGTVVSAEPKDAERQEDAKNMSYPYVAIEEYLDVVGIGHGDTQKKAIEDAERQLKNKVSNSNENTKQRYKELLMYMANHENFYAKRRSEKGTPTA